MAAQTVTKVQYENNVTVIGADNLNAIQDAVNNHAGLIDDLGSDKVDKVEGKGLSTNDFTTDAQSKLNNLPTGEQLDTSLGQKVSKRTSGTEVYTHTGSTQGGATLTETPTAGAVPLYGTGGVLKAAAPVAANDVVRKAELDGVKDNLDAAFVVNTASGAIASFPDGADGVPIKSLVVNIEAKQAGTGDPSPENIRPISGWTGAEIQQRGKNLIDDSKRYTASQTTVYIGAESSAYTVALPAGTYTISVDFSGEPYGMFYREANDTDNRSIWSSGTAAVTERTLTIEEDGVFRFWAYLGANAGGIDPTKIIHVQLEKGSTASTYEPYTGNQISVTFPTSAGTVYGGSLNLITGVLTVDRLAADLGNTTWTKPSSTGDYFISGSLDYLIDPNIVVKPLNATTPPDILCSFYNPSIASRVINATYDNIIGIGSSNGRFLIRDSSVNTVEALTAKVTGQKVVARIEPQTYQLTESQITGILTTLHGNNNVWADCGDTEVTYCADTKVYIDSKPSGVITVEVTGTDPVITAEANHRYICGQVNTITFTPCASGICDVVFTSGTTPAVLSVPGTVNWPDWFSAGTMDASTTYELNVMDGTLGAVAAWT